jgi:sucrose-phosphate synthase
MSDLLVVQVVPPGMDFSHVVVQTTSKGSSADLASQGDEDPGTPRSPKPEPPIWAEVNRFFSNPHKPMILALARADPKKNLPTLVEAFGQNKHLRDTANLVGALLNCKSRPPWLSRLRGGLLY